MRRKTESGNVVSSHSSAWGASSLMAKLRIDSRSCSCSSVKMKCLRPALKSGFCTLAAVAAMSGGLLVLSLWVVVRGEGGEPASCRHLVGDASRRGCSPKLPQDGGKVNSRAAHFSQGCWASRALPWGVDHVSPVSTPFLVATGTFPPD